MKVKLKSQLLPHWHIRHLQADKIHEVIEVGFRYYRLIGGWDNKPYLYDKRAFDIIDPSIPNDWVYEVYTEDIGEAYQDPDVEEMIYQDFIEEYYIIPRCFTIYRNFFERYHDDDPECIKIFNEYIKTNNIL
ncbi:MAG: hypothetical protein Q4B81_04290 [Moraxella sp.]|nr:hypothetical protein [Moraxella sp.]